MTYLGNTPTTQSFISGTDYFNGTGSQTAFTLSRTVASVNDIEAVVNNVVQRPNDAYTISGTTITFTSAPSAGTNNVYVRYLSTTTQAIAPSQNTVSWNTLDTNTQNDLGLMYKNKIINGNMVIDQRNAGASVSITNVSPYTVDRWFGFASQSSKFTVQQNAGSVTPPTGFTNYLGVTSLSAYSVGASEQFLVQHRIEGFNCADLAWGTANAKTVTLSFWVRSSLTGTFGGALFNNSGNRSYPFTYTISSANTWEYKTITIVGETTGTWLTTNGVGICVNFSMGVGASLSGTAGAWASAYYPSATGATSVVGTNGATWYLTGVQLEVGTQATAFSTAGGSYGAELALCQRYFINERLSGYGLSGFCDTTTTAIFYLTFRQTMRGDPSLATVGTFEVRRSGVASSSGTVSAIQVTPDGARVNVSSSSLTAGQGVGLTAGSGTANLQFSAEL